MKQALYSVWETVEAIVIAFAAVFFIKAFLVQPFVVQGSSMVPSFHSGDYVLADELTYRFRDPERGEIVVFRYPGNLKTYYIKRIIGLPHERLVLKSGSITVFNTEYPEGLTLKEGYLPSSTAQGAVQEVTLRGDEYFVMGDNRAYSYDSRSWGMLPEEDIIGVVRFRLLPITRVMAVEKPIY